MLTTVVQSKITGIATMVMEDWQKLGRGTNCILCIPEYVYQSSYTPTHHDIATCCCVKLTCGNYLGD
jgi:hypothetical protein